MSIVECAGSAVCRQYCEALRSNGVAVQIDNAGCNVPAMFTIREAGITFNPEASGEDLSMIDSDLVGAVGGALCNVLMERNQADPNQKTVVELIEGYNETLVARMTLWQAMLKATRDRRNFTDAELQFYQDNLDQIGSEVKKKEEAANQEAVFKARAAADRANLNEHKLLFDDQVTKTVDRLVGNLNDGNPTLLIGDKGIAKTQAAKYVAKLWDPENEPVIISGHGDMMSNELIGQMEQNKDTRVFAFKEGKLVKAMREGRPVIIDEVNIGDQPVVMRLQDILLRRPGERILIQENGGDSIEIQPGFVIFATANEASARYLHRNVLDPAFRDRFDIINLRYTDSDSPPTPTQNIPPSLMRLALAAAVDEHGVISPHIDLRELEQLARLSHCTQYLYSTPAHSATLLTADIKLQTSDLLDTETVMTDCITPRTLVDTVQRCARGNKPGMSLESEMQRLIIALDQTGSTYNQTLARKILVYLQR